MNDDIKTLDKALNSLRKKLCETHRNEPGYRVMRDLYRDLHIELLNNWEQSDKEIAEEIKRVAEEVKKDWDNTQNMDHYRKQLIGIAKAVGFVLKIIGAPNPLEFLIG